jgi:hypothetical protein
MDVADAGDARSKEPAQNLPVQLSSAFALRARCSFRHLTAIDGANTGNAGARFQCISQLTSHRRPRQPSMIYSATSRSPSSASPLMNREYRTVASIVLPPEFELAAAHAADRQTAQDRSDPPSQRTRRCRLRRWKPATTDVRGPTPSDVSSLMDRSVNAAAAWMRWSGLHRVFIESPQPSAADAAGNDVIARRVTERDQSIRIR